MLSSWRMYEMHPALFLKTGCYRLVILPPPLLEDLSKALDDELHFLIVEVGGVDGEREMCTWAISKYFGYLVSNTSA
jgi:hypothetical protein